MTAPILVNGNFILLYSKVPLIPPPLPSLLPGERPTSIPFKQQQFGLWNWETLKDFERN